MSSLQPNVSDFNAFLSSVQSIHNPVLIPDGLVHPGFAYNIVAVMCTFLGRCGRASHQMVVTTSMNVPVISINSARVRSVFRSSALSIRGSAYTSECGGSTTPKNLKYEWSLYERDASSQVVSKLTDPSFQSVSSDSRLFALKSFSLVVGAEYSARLTVTHSGSLKSSSASVDIFVAKGEIVAVLSVASQMGMRYDSSFLLDVGDSYDEDNDATSAGAPSSDLVYSFECKQLSPSYKANCELTFESLSTSSVRVSLNNQESNMIDSVFEVKVIIRIIC